MLPGRYGDRFHRLVPGRARPRPALFTQKTPSGRLQSPPGTRAEIHGDHRHTGGTLASASTSPKRSGWCSGAAERGPARTKRSCPQHPPDRCSESSRSGEARRARGKLPILNDARDHQRQPAPPGHFDGQMNALIRVDPAEERSGRRHDYRSGCNERSMPLYTVAR